MKTRGSARTENGSLRESRSVLGLLTVIAIVPR
jgi:hypothetical protein